MRIVTVIALAGTVLALPPTASAAEPWQAQRTEGERGSICVQAGQRGPDDRLGRVLPGGRFRAHEPGDLRVCGGSFRPRGRGTALLIAHVVADPAAPRPRIGRLVVAGLAGRGIRSVLARTNVGARTVRPDADGVWIATFGRRARHASLAIFERYDDGVRVTDYRRGSRRWRMQPGSARVEARRPDPAGGPGLGMLVWRTVRGDRCSAVGDVVDGRVGSYRAGAGEFWAYPIHDGGSCFDARSEFARRSVVWRTQTDVTADGLVVTVSGFARRDVRRVVVRGLGSDRVLSLSPRSRAFLVRATLPGDDAPGVRVEPVRSR